MSTRIIGKEQAQSIAQIGWWNSERSTGVPQPFCPSAAPSLLDDGPGEVQLMIDPPAQDSDPTAEWIVRLEQASQQGYAKGLLEGERASTEKANLAMKPTLEGLAKSIAEFASLRRRIRSEAEQDLVKLALAVAKKILHRELTVDPGALAGVVKAALANIDAREVDNIRLNPKDAAALGDLVSTAGLQPNAQIIADLGLTTGAILITTSRGQLDASVSAQLNEIERGFADRLEGR